MGKICFALNNNNNRKGKIDAKRVILPKPLSVTTEAIKALRVQTFFHKAFRVFHAYCKFILGYVLDYRNFWYTYRWKSFNQYLCIKQ